ncbi:MAG: hypothetical protein QM571_05130, partial [Micrococcaceae bacterium]
KISLYKYKAANAGISRRGLAKGALWSVPTISAAIAVPANATSTITNYAFDFSFYQITGTNSANQREVFHTYAASWDASYASSHGNPLRGQLLESVIVLNFWDTETSDPVPAGLQFTIAVLDATTLEEVDLGFPAFPSVTVEGGYAYAENMFISEEAPSGTYIFRIIVPSQSITIDTLPFTII